MSDKALHRYTITKAVIETAHTLTPETSVTFA
jgi:hypothetical protein